MEIGLADSSIDLYLFPLLMNVPLVKISVYNKGIFNDSCERFDDKAYRLTTGGPDIRQFFRSYLTILKALLLVLFFQSLSSSLNKIRSRKNPIRLASKKLPPLGGSF